MRLVCFAACFTCSEMIQKKQRCLILDFLIWRESCKMMPQLQLFPAACCFMSAGITEIIWRKSHYANQCMPGIHSLEWKKKNNCALPLKP